MKNKDTLPDFSKLCPPEQNHIALFLSQQVFFFFLCSIGGFLWEVAIFLIKDGSFANRGFLYGPWLPVYGSGAVLFYLLLADKTLLTSGSRRDTPYVRRPSRRPSGAVYGYLPFREVCIPPGRAFLFYRKQYFHSLQQHGISCRVKKHPVAVFLLSLLIGTGLELLIGWFLDMVWNLRYWDYRAYPFNFHGYICLYSAAGFGIAGVLWVCVLADFSTKLWLRVPASVRLGVNTLLTLLFALDCAAALIFPNIGRGITFSP